MWCTGSERRRRDELKQSGEDGGGDGIELLLALFEINEYSLTFTFSLSLSHTEEKERNCGLKWSQLTSEILDCVSLREVCRSDRQESRTFLFSGTIRVTFFADNNCLFQFIIQCFVCVSQNDDLIAKNFSVVAISTE